MPKNVTKLIADKAAITSMCDVRWPMSDVWCH